MGAQTNIQWCDHTYNPWRGCRKVAEECENCYITGTTPFRVAGQTHGSVRVRAGADYLKEPLRWNKKPWICDHCGLASAVREGVCVSCKQVGKHRAKVFCLSLGDWLDDENVPVFWLGHLMQMIVESPHLNWLLLTKRPRNWRKRISLALSSLEGIEVDWPSRDAITPTGTVLNEWLGGEPPANVWIGVSQGADQKAALEIPAVVHFLSCEPMLRPLDLTHAYRFDWIIFGGESGPNARPCNVDWIQAGLKYCRYNNIAAFVKQLGARPFEDDSAVMGAALDVANLPLLPGARMKHPKGGDISEWPEQLRVREFPKVRAMA